MTHDELARLTAASARFGASLQRANTAIIMLAPILEGLLQGATKAHVQVFDRVNLARALEKGARALNNLSTEVDGLALGLAKVEAPADPVVARQ